MIEKAVIEYLLSIPDLQTMLGGRIYYRLAPTTVKMPYLVVTNSGGMRRKETQPDFYSSAKDTLTLYVDHKDLFVAKDIAVRVVEALENYRGIFMGIPDTHIRAETTRDLVGFMGTFRQQISVHIQYRIPTNTPH
jgi:hypothetical protein